MLTNILTSHSLKMKWFPRVGTLDDVIDWPPHPSPRLCWWHVCSLQLRHQTSHLYDDTSDDVIKGHSHGVSHLIQWLLLLPTAIDLLCAERRFMATFLSPITSRRCVFCGSQGIAKGNYCGSQWVNHFSDSHMGKHLPKFGSSRLNGFAKI